MANRSTTQVPPDGTQPAWRIRHCSGRTTHPTRAGGGRRVSPGSRRRQRRIQPAGHPRRHGWSGTRSADRHRREAGHHPDAGNVDPWLGQPDAALARGPLSGLASSSEPSSLPSRTRSECPRYPRKSLPACTEGLVRLSTLPGPQAETPSGRAKELAFGALESSICTRMLHRSGRPGVSQRLRSGAVGGLQFRRDPSERMIGARRYPAELLKER